MIFKNESENNNLDKINVNLYLKKYQWWVPYFGTKANLKLFKRFLSENYTITSVKKIYQFGVILLPLYLFYEVFFSSLFNVYSRENGYDMVLVSVRIIVQSYSLFIIWGFFPPFILVLLKSKVPSIPVEEDQLTRKSAPWLLLMMTFTFFQFPIVLYFFIEGGDFLRLLVPVFTVSIFFTTVLFRKYAWFFVIESFSIQEHKIT